MKLIIAATFVFTLCFSSLALCGGDKCPAAAEALPICTVLANASKYDGKEITVRGLYRMVIHGSILSGPECFNTNINLRGSPGYKADSRAAGVERSLTKKDQFRKIDEVLRGTFRVAHTGQCFGQNCLSYEVEVVELLCAAPVKPISP
jgi:hypothetical protein